MKKTIIALNILAVILISFRMTSREPNMAQVYKWQGFYVFMQCTPTTSYTVLGTVKDKGIVGAGQPKDMFSAILKNVKKDYPDADGIIFDPVNTGRGTCIKFKE